MKLLNIFAFSLLTLTLFSACQLGEIIAGEKVAVYDFDTARISYEITGSSEGSSEVLIKGDKKVIKNNILQTKVDGTQNQVKTYTIQDGERVYRLDEMTKTGNVVTNPLYLELQKMNPQEREERLIKEAVRTNIDSDEMPEPIRSETVAGQTCDVYTSDFSEICLWQTVPLKSVDSLEDYGIQTTTIATNLELNVEIPDSEFEVPSDYQINELN